ncbi:MAG: nucleoside monophosphate kinase [bacterium]|nr:nucleoside monophosphate kinase [bacterium]
MSPQTFIFIGRSGCGKGTQADLLQKYLKTQDPGREIFYLETGSRFRDFIKGDSLSSKLSLAISQEEKLQPSFLAVWMWSHLFIENLKGNEHIISDGTPRSVDEARVLDSAIRFYDRMPAYVVYLNVSRSWAEDRLQNRGRADDQNKDRIKKRLDWFETDVLPAVNHLREHPEYRFLDINGERPLEEVHKEIIKNIKV